MTIRYDWCPTCEESCHDHATLCTTCGDALQARPPSATRSRTTNNNNATTTTVTRVIPEFMVQELRDSNQELTALLSNLRQRVSDIRQQVSDIRGMTQLNNNNNNNTTNDGWLNGTGITATTGLPPEAMDPSAAQQRSKPTSKQVLASIPRIVLHESSSLLQKIDIQIVVPSTSTTTTTTTTTKTWNAIAADFGPPIHMAPRTISNAKLVLAGTGKHGVAVPKPKSISTSTSNNRDDDPLIFYMERGDNITFCQKALLAQQAGASAVIIGNNTNASWPFVMQDTKMEAKGNKINNNNDTTDSIDLLNIPVVMISQSSGRELVQYFNQTKSQPSSKTTLLSSSSSQPLSSSASSLLISYHMEPISQECIICVESCSIGNTVLQLPKCHHVFHERCALLWLEHHNSCPYCRQELPMEHDNNNHNREPGHHHQQQLGLNHNDAGGDSTERNSESFYG